MVVFPQVALNLLKQIEVHQYDAYLVGGCVRDALLNIETHDIDICTNMPFELLVTVFVDYKPKLFERFGNLTFKVDQYDIEITRFRKEGVYLNHRHPSTLDFEAGLLDDLMRRDFTINGILYHTTNGILDYVDGMYDIKHRLLRTINDSVLTFQEDYLRMLRLIRFQSQTGFEIETETYQAWKSNFYKISHLSWNQVRPEFIKLIMTENFVDTVYTHPNILLFLIDEFKVAYTFDQNNQFHKYNLFEHTLEVMRHLDGLELRLAGLFHDLGKIHTKVVKDNGQFGYPNHAKESEKIAFRYLEGTAINVDLVCKLIRYHDLSIPTDYVAMKKLVSKHGLEFMRMLIDFKKADNIAKSDLAFYQIEKCDQYHRFLDTIEIEKPVLLIKDLDIKGDALGVDAASRKMALEYLLMGVIEGKIENKKEVLLKEVKRWDILR